jgi:hypothetical protein
MILLKMLAKIKNNLILMNIPSNKEKNVNGCFEHTIKYREKCKWMLLMQNHKLLKMRYVSQFWGVEFIEILLGFLLHSRWIIWSIFLLQRLIGLKMLPASR